MPCPPLDFRGARWTRYGGRPAMVIRVEEAATHVGEEVEIRGWLYNKRSSGRIHFLVIRDGSGLMQAVMAKTDVSAEAFAAADRLTQESAVRVSGVVRADQRAPGGFELLVRDLQIVQLAEPYPITPKEHGVEFLGDHRHLWLRSRRQHALMRIRAEVIRAATEFLDRAGYLRVDTPILTPAAVEGTTTLFETPYFDLGKAYLTQSGQLYNEAAAMAFGQVYCFGPTFRAEKSKTRRHLTEFWMLEPEAAYVEMDEAMELAEGLVTAIVQSVLKDKPRELEMLKRDTTKLENVRPPFPRISYEDAIGVLQKNGNPAKFGDDFGGDEETLISKEFDRPVLIHHYPSAMKAFYMQPDAQRPELALAFDMIAPEGYGEIIGGSQRIHDYDLLVKRLREH